MFFEFNRSKQSEWRISAFVFFVAIFENWRLPEMTL